MAYFNPKPLEFNPNSKVIEASGALGDALFQMYQQSVKNRREQEKLDEDKRSNLANEAFKKEQFDYTQKKDQRDFDFDKFKFDTQTAQKEREFNADQAHRRASLGLQWANHNLRANELARAQKEREAELARQQQAQDIEHNAYFDYGLKNGYFGERANSDEFKNLTPQQKAQIGANLKAQMSAQGQIYKANEPLFKMQEQERQRAEANRANKAKNLQIVDIASQRANDFGLNDSDLKVINEMKAKAMQGDTKALKDLQDIGAQLGSQIATRNEIDKNLGVKPMTQQEKNAIAKLQTQKVQTENLIKALDTTIANDYARGGIDKNSGIIDSAIINTPLRNFSNDASDKLAEVNIIGDTYKQQQKGLGKFNYEMASDRVMPSVLGSKSAVAQTIAMRNQALNDLENIANQMIAQGYKGGYELLEQVENQRINDKELSDMMFGKGQNLLGKQNAKSSGKKPSQAELRAKWGVANKGDYDEADELGYVY